MAQTSYRRAGPLTQSAINGSYTYSSPAQRALYPGDKIVYTLTFVASYGNYYSNNPYNYQGQNYYYGNTYTGGVTSYTCNAYGPCINNGVTQYPQYPNYIQNLNYPNNSANNAAVTIVADPYNTIQEQNKQNNVALTGQW